MAGVVGQHRRDQLLPAIFYLSDFRHVSHGAAGIEIGKNGNLAGLAEDIGALRHEMHAAKDDVFAARLRCFLSSL